MTEEEAQGYADWVDEIRAEVSGQKAAITSASTDNADPTEETTMNRDEAKDNLRYHLIDSGVTAERAFDWVFRAKLEMVDAWIESRKSDVAKVEAALAALTGENAEGELNSQGCSFCGGSHPAEECAVVFRPLKECGWQNPEDGCCSHPNSCPECHVAACPLLDRRVAAGFHPAGEDSLQQMWDSREFRIYPPSDGHVRMRFELENGQEAFLTGDPNMTEERRQAFAKMIQGAYDAAVSGTLQEGEDSQS